MFSLRLLSAEVTGRLPGWCMAGPTGELQPQPRGCSNLPLHSDLQLGRPGCHAQVLFLLSKRLHGWWWQKTYFSWKLATIIAAREQGFSEGHQSLRKAQLAEAQVTARVTFSAQICSFSLPLVFHFCWVNKTRPSSAVTNFQSHLCSRIDRAIVGTSNLLSLDEIFQEQLSERRCWDFAVYWIFLCPQPSEMRRVSHHYWLLLLGVTGCPLSILSQSTACQKSVFHWQSQEIPENLSASFSPWAPSSKPGVRRMRKPTLPTNPSAKISHGPLKKNSIPLDNKQIIIFITDAKVNVALQTGK